VLGSRPEAEPVAIIGIHGQYPQSRTLSELWDHLSRGADLVTTVPTDRWDSEDYYDPDPQAAAQGKIYCKWGGFLDDCDKFDARFFNISAEEALRMDPQERLFLQSVWSAIEDAGYTRASLRRRFPKGKSANVGVFVGVTTNSYHLRALQRCSGAEMIALSALPWSIANRVSYFFDFNGPSMPVDTACSSSLVAIHLACQSLKNAECQIAIAGGVNLYLHESKYQSLCQKRMLALHGRCRSYGAGDDGFVPAEGLGSLVLKPLGMALKDRDRIYAVIRGSAVDHSGRSNGYSSPNPQAQAAVIRDALQRSGITADTVGFVEGHGTGTQMGDSLEIAALSQVFREQTSQRQFCALSSIKGNMGHAEAAAGMAAVAKTVLQLKHAQLVPSVHADVVNPDIQFKDSPFQLQRTCQPWNRPHLHPRRALANSFGAGGVNACVVIEEYEDRSEPTGNPVPGRHVFVLSARDTERLRAYASNMLSHLKPLPDSDLIDVCHTLQVGREPMKERLAIVASGKDELIAKLERWIAGERVAELQHGDGAIAPATDDIHAGKNAVLHSPTELARSWARGLTVNWDQLYPGYIPRLVALPTYPFMKERFWLDQTSSVVVSRAQNGSKGLHPLISHNSSTLSETCFDSALSEDEFYAVDHLVRGERVFPGAGFLEMASVAGALAGESKVRQIKDIVWVSPLSFAAGARRVRTSLKNTAEGSDFTITSCDEAGLKSVLAEGKLIYGARPAEGNSTWPEVSLQALKERCNLSRDGAEHYDMLRGRGLDYGPAFRSIREIHFAEGFVLARLQIPQPLQARFGEFMLHPCIIDGAFQAAGALVSDPESGEPHVPFALDAIEMLQPLPQSCYAYVRFAECGNEAAQKVKTFAIQLLSERGDPLARITNFIVRMFHRKVVVPLPKQAARYG
jgi:acyl transferase domain-containing protein